MPGKAGGPFDSNDDNVDNESILIIYRYDTTYDIPLPKKIVTLTCCHYNRIYKLH